MDVINENGYQIAVFKYWNRTFKQIKIHHAKLILSKRFWKFSVKSTVILQIETRRSATFMLLVFLV